MQKNISENKLEKDVLGDDFDRLVPFTEPIRAEFSNDGKSLTLLRGFAYYRKGQMNNAEWQEAMVDSSEHIYPEREQIVVPSGFVSDGFTNFGMDKIVQRYGKGLKCAILHDYLCELYHKDEITRKEADNIFLESMLETKAFSKNSFVNACKALILYAGVRIWAKIKGYDN